MTRQTAFYVSQEEFNLFHSIDRQLYRILVVNLWRDPLESMQIVAFWLWLERSGFNNAVTKMLSLPFILVNEIADETLTCLNSITSSSSSSSSPPSTADSSPHDIPLIQSLMEKEIDLGFFHRNGAAAAHGIAKIVNEVCLRGLKDIMEAAGERNKMTSGMKLAAAAAAAGWSINNGNSNGNSGREAVPADDRTMFVTFSKGYPVYEWEVREFFGRSYGECIESLYMQEVEGNEQSLFARIVFKSPSTIDNILNGMGKAKFTINSKHVWARKFVPKRSKPFSPSSSATSSSSSSSPSPSPSPYDMPVFPHLPFSVS